ncbi:ATP-binding protein [Streptomyces sp. NPDC021093]|uniref:ATP-binding protein n=1 Tax=Streptomyces sp. NPDC021093 TaxID=3365112 RepID=UPI0037976A75
MGHHPGKQQVAMEHRHSCTVPLVPGSVRAARERAERSLALFGMDAGSSLGGAVLLVVSELVANAVRHAQGSPDAEITLTKTDRLLVVRVGDLDPCPILLASRSTGEGLRTVEDLARAYDGDVHVQPAADGNGKTVVVRFVLPDPAP